MEKLRLQGGFTYLHVPYKGSMQIITEIMGSRIHGTILGIGPVAPLVQAGKLRLLAVTSPKRADLFPDVPSIAETLPGYDSRGWFGYLAPAKTSRRVIALLNEEINRAMANPDVKDKLNAIGQTVVAESPEFFAHTMKADYDKYGELIRQIGLEPR
jgi:tripartite-type tricarboxylate transporter receptor subunit TctC